ncbi:MAG TPA: NAD(P)H-hydrate dehydratase [Pyrinomonadaceae bacterium]|nr:NAD(P)H-hydrate dehydratase [Pyrinomonadaceae bacterium]
MSGVRGRRKAGKSQHLTPDTRPLLVSPTLLHRWPLPQPDEDGDKEERGRVLVVGGSAEMPGAVLLAATAALRAGAGKLQIATNRSVAQSVAVSVPEARIFALPETKAGAIAVSAAAEIIERASKVNAVLFGPGMINEETVARLVSKVLPRIGKATVILDAAALHCFKESPQCLHDLDCKAILTPHAGEMAKMMNVSKSTVTREPLAIAREAARNLRAVVVLKGAETHIASHNSSKSYCNRAGNVGLATSGSGDTLSGVITGLAARGATPLQAAIWGVYLHARAGDVLAKRVGRLGYLARELLAEVPALMSKLGEGKKS